MTRWGYRIQWLGMLAGCVAALALARGCSSDTQSSNNNKKDAGQDGANDTGTDALTDGNNVDVKANCQLVGTTCASNSDCCSANCDPKLQACANPVGSCKTAGQACSAPTDCCTMVCTGGKCGSTLCTSDNQPCTTDGECCGGTCASGPDGGPTVCQPLNPACSTSGNQCNANSDCCSSVCTNGTCSGSVSFCRQTGDVCAKDTDCCGGICDIQSGAKIGLCATPAAPGGTQCLVAGEVCSGGATGDGGTVPQCGGSCCSRACGPYGPTGVYVCQPASGCRPTGEVCTKDADCCGSSAVPGGGNGSVHCSKAAGEKVGRCDNGTSCRPAGAVCKLATSSCNAENNCCAGNVNQDPTVCQQDLLGVPRCTGVGNCGDAGSQAGKACSTSADCCGLPCLPNANGTGFICGDSCVKAGGACTSNADCCAGLPCTLDPGSSSGTCGAPPTGDAGVDSGVPEGGTDAGPTCALLGQSCTQSSDCCNGVPCTNGRCNWVIPQ